MQSMPPRCKRPMASVSVAETGVPPARLTSSTAAPTARTRLPLNSATDLIGELHMKTEAAPE